MRVYHLQVLFLSSVLSANLRNPLKGCRKWPRRDGLIEYLCEDGRRYIAPRLEGKAFAVDEESAHNEELPTQIQTTETQCSGPEDSVSPQPHPQCDCRHEAASNCQDCSVSSEFKPKECWTRTATYCLNPVSSRAPVTESDINRDPFLEGKAATCQDSPTMPSKRSNSSCSLYRGPTLAVSFIITIMACILE